MAPTYRPNKLPRYDKIIGVDDRRTQTTGLDALAKTNAVIEILESDGELAVGGISAAIGLPKSSTYRLLRDLVAVGFVDRGSKRGLFRVGAYFLTVGGIVEERLDLRRVARDVLQQLSFETGWTWSLYIPRGAQATCIERFEGPRVRTSRIRVGDSFPMHSAAGPRAILSFLPEAQRLAVIEQIYSGESSVALPTPARQELEERIAADSARGYTVADEVVARGIAGIGVPIRNHRGDVEGAVVAGYLREVLLAPASPALELVRGAATTISRALGHRGAD